MSHLFPIRIDAISDDGSVRLVDTLLIDPGCLPIPLSPSIHAEDGRSCATQSCIEENVHEIADTLLADMEVCGTTRTAKHFSGRVDLLNIPSLRKQVEEQIREQLQLAVSMYLGGRERVEDGKKNEGSESTSTSATNFGKETPKEEQPSTLQDSKLIRIKLRLREQNVVIIDEFDYDPNTPPEEGGCPIAIANGIVNDLNLPPEYAVSIATSIVEQVHGLKVEDDISGMTDKRAQRSTPAAWTVDAKETALLQAQVISDFQPKIPAGMN